MVGGTGIAGVMGGADVVAGAGRAVVAGVDRVGVVGGTGIAGVMGGADVVGGTVMMGGTVTVGVVGGPSVPRVVQ